MTVSKMAFSLITLCGVAFVGGSWYSGKLAEEKYQSYIDHANQEFRAKFAKFGADIAISNVAFTRHFFTSDMRYQIVLKDKARGETIEFPVEGVLYHGPFPLNRLKQFSLIPMMFSAENQFVAINPIKSYVDDKYMATVITDIGYSGEMRATKIMTPKVNFHERKGTETLEGTVSAGEIAIAKTTSNQWMANYQLPYVEMKTKNKQNPTTMDFRIDRISGNSVWDHGEWLSYYFGNSQGEIAIDSMTLSNDKNKFFLDDIRAESHSQIKDGRLQVTNKGNVDIHAELATAGAVNFGKISMGSLIELDSNAYAALIDQIPLSQANVAPDNQKLARLAEALVAKPIKFAMGPIVLENTKGKNSFELIAGIKGLTPKQAETLSPDEILKVFTDSRVAFDLNLQSLEELIRQFGLLDTQNKEEAAQQAKQIMNMFVQQAQQLQRQNLLMMDNESISFKLELNNGIIQLNDKEISLTELSKLFSPQPN